jgi:hypothetical protein
MNEAAMDADRPPRVPLPPYIGIAYRHRGDAAVRQESKSISSRPLGRSQ